ncbi:MAG: hypothetical protein U5N86_06135 [Planctomycetota bacterium]|nr:hypothetical protein [Planctomycetota bacterium]
MSRRFALLFFCFVFFAVITSLRAEEAHDPEFPIIQKAYRQNRLDNQDIMFFNNGDVLKGTVQNDKIAITTTYGKAEIPLRRCVGLLFDGANADSDSVTTVNYNKFTGSIDTRSIEFRIGTSKTELKIRTKEINLGLLPKTRAEV